MAKNRKYAEGNNFPIPVSVGVVSGQPVALGALPGVALVDRDGDGQATCQFDGVFELEVTGADDEGNAAVTAGAIVYLQSNGDLNINDTTGVRFGYALEPVSSGASTVIPVKIGY